MADAGVARDPERLPWLEPYRAPLRKPSNRRPGVAAAIGAVGLTGVLTLLMRAVSPAVDEPASPQASIVLPAPIDMQPQIVLPPLVKREPTAAIPLTSPSVPVHPANPHVQRRIEAISARSAYRTMVRSQGGEPVEQGAEVSEAAMAIAALPLPPDPPRPVVDPAAQVVRGKTVQLGVFRTEQQAEVAWRSAIRDYTYLVTMPKSIEPVSIRSRRYYRLQLGTPSRKHAKQLCSNLKSIGRACTVA